MIKFFVKYLYFRLRGLKIGKIHRLPYQINIGEGKNIELGGKVYINKYCSLLGGFVGKIYFGDNVLVGPGVVITAANHSTDKSISFSEQIREDADVVVGDEVWIGANSVILPGVTLPTGTIVAAGSIVTKSPTQEYTIIAGVPAKFLKYR